MRPNVWLPRLIMIFIFGAAGPAMSAGTDDIEPLQGGWTMVLVFRNGEEVPTEQARSGELIVEDEDYRAKLGEMSVTATIKVNASRAPKEIDLTFTSGDQQGKMVKGIYKINGDDLTICRGLTEKEARPTEFAAPVDSGLLLVTWKRSKTFVSKKTQAIEDEFKRFEATWRFVEIEVDGQKVPEKAFEKDTLILKGKRFSSFVGGKLVHGDFKIDPLAKPKTIDIIFGEGPGKGHSQKGIYELTEDTQKICIAGPDQPRPTEFATSPGSGYIIEVLKREKR